MRWKWNNVNKSDVMQGVDVSHDAEDGLQVTRVKILLVEPQVPKKVFWPQSSGFRRNAEQFVNARPGLPFSLPPNCLKQRMRTLHALQVLKVSPDRWRNSWECRRVHVV